MSNEFDPQWLRWARALQALAQTGLTFCGNPYDCQRYEELRRIAAEMMAAGSDASVTRIVDLFARQEGYATPKVDVRGVIFRDDAILLVKELIDNRWTLPGGWADVNETPSEACVREVFEESGFETRATKLLAVFDRTKHGHEPPHPFHVYKLFFRCEITGGSPTTSNETGAVAFFREDELPNDLSITRVTPWQVKRLFEHYRNPDWPADYD